MPGLIGKKIGMTSVFGADGKNIPCTVIEAGPCVVTQLRTVEKDGYAAVQLAYDEIKEIHASAPLMGHFKKAGPPLNASLSSFRQTSRVSSSLETPSPSPMSSQMMSSTLMLSVLQKAVASRVLFTVIISPV